MKTRILTAMIPLLVTGALATDTHARAHSVTEAQATAPELQLSKKSPDIFELKNGMRVFYYESDRVPLVTVRAVVRAGDIWEPADRMGVANLTGRMMRAGGSLAWPADTMDEELDFLAARLSSGIGDEMGNVTLNVLSENLDDALAIFADLMLHPRFDDTKMSVEKGLIKEDIRRENDNPIQVAFREYDKLIWGEDHPRARTPTGESVDALTVEDLQAFHAAFFQPGNVSFGVAGDVSKRSIRRKLNQLFGDWKGPEVVFPATPPVPERTPRVALAVKEVPQTTVLLGHLGPMETDPMRYSGQVMMNILGSGGFTSYIVDRVRNDEGLAYFAGGFLDFGM
ncbi:MAG: pitrilysin family protein, partial [Gemmatimonadota bacterium]|nr:pitrilysin family protein [Gemmatimonadota bacterium]